MKEDMLYEVCDLLSCVRGFIEKSLDGDEIESVNKGLETLLDISEHRDDVAKTIMLIAKIAEASTEENVSVAKNSDNWPTLNNKLMPVIKARAGIDIEPAEPVEGKLWPSLQRVG